MHRGGEAEALKIQKAAEVESYRMQAMAEAEEMRMKGYTYQQETSRQVGLETMKNGISGGEGRGVLSGIGDLAGLGIGLGAMSSVIGMTKDAVGSMFAESEQMESDALGGSIQTPSFSWNCSCGRQMITSKFCPECGAKRGE